MLIMKIVPPTLHSRIRFGYLQPLHNSQWQQLKQAGQDKRAEAREQVRKDELKLFEATREGQMPFLGTGGITAETVFDILFRSLHAYQKAKDNAGRSLPVRETSLFSALGLSQINQDDLDTALAIQEEHLASTLETTVQLIAVTRHESQDGIQALKSYKSYCRNSFENYPDVRDLLELHLSQPDLLSIAKRAFGQLEGLDPTAFVVAMDKLSGAIKEARSADNLIEEEKQMLLVSVDVLRRSREHFTEMLRLHRYPPQQFEELMQGVQNAKHYTPTSREWFALKYAFLNRFTTEE